MDKKDNDIVLKITNLQKGYKMFARKKDRFLETVLPMVQRHGMFYALDDFNLEVRKGEILGVLGKNGAGKSTLLKMITGVVTPTLGTIEAKGKISSLLELGTAFNPELTGIENIYQEFADIGEHLHQPVKTYSSGMFARLAFACAINVDPDILIVDEVLSVGDMAFQLKCFKKFEQFKKQGKTILFVTHSVADVLKNCNKAIVIDKGRKIFDGRVKPGVELYKKLITGMLDENYKDKKQTIETSKEEVLKENVEWKQHFTINPDMTVYGNNEARIYDYGIFNKEGRPETLVNNNEDIIIKLKVLFNENIEDPIISITIKDFNGKEICGTNTEFLGIETGKFEKGQSYIFEFKQKTFLAPGKYTLSVSCTRYDKDGNHIIMNRNYDAIIFEVMSDDKFVGYYEIQPKVKFKEIKKG